MKNIINFYKKHHKILIISFLLIIVISLLSGTYAMFQRIDKAEYANNYKTGNLQIEFTSISGTINLEKQVPITDEEGKNLTPYKFKITNVGNLAYTFDLKLVLDSNYIESHGCNDNIIPNEYIKVQFNNEEPILLSNLSNNTIISNITLQPSAYINFSLRMWIAEGSPNDIMGKHYHAKITSTGQAVSPENIIYNEPNAPVLADGMIPVTYDESKSTWVKADINNTNNSWYDYDNKKWANAVMVKSSSITYDYYLDDLSGNNYDAKLMNGAKVVTIGGQKAIELDGVDDYIEVPTLPADIGLTNGYTVEVSMQWKTLGSYARIMDFGNGAASNNLIIANWGTYSTPYVIYYNGASGSHYPYVSMTFTANTKETYKFVLTKGSSYYTLKMYLNNSLQLTSTSDIPVGAFQDIQRTKNYIGKSNWADPYLSAYIYNFKILDSTGKAIISYDADNVIRSSYGNTTLSDGTLCTGTDNSCTREDYMNAKMGVEIPEEDVLAYYVWIPRYKYQLFNATYASGTSSQLIDVVFENGTSTTGTVTCTYDTNGNETCTNKSNGNYYTHPAFTFGSTELKGIWVGKFETTGSETTPTVKPGISSLAGITVSSMYSTGLLFRSTDYLTTNGVSTADSHMMKNIEWGAVAYLKQSIYGLGITDIGINSNNSYYTGGGSGTSYKTNTGQSTTGNITGVYDMSGGAYEYVMGNYGKTKGSSGLTVSEVPAEHIDIYSGTSVSASHLGDALGETAGWYSDFARFVSSSHPWFVRGGYYVDGDSAGVFYFGAGTGEDDGDSRGFRVVLSTMGA